MADEQRSTADIAAGFSALLDPPISEDETPDQGTLEVSGTDDAPDAVAQADPDAETETDAGDEGETSPTDDGVLWTGLVDGQERQITDPAELNKNVALGLAFGQRNRELAEQRRTFEGEQTALQQTRSETTDLLELANQFLQAPLGARPTREQYPDVTSYDQALQAWDAGMAQVQAVTEHITTERAQAETRRQDEIKRFVEDAEVATLAQIPEWGDQAVRVEEARQIEEYLISKGATPDIFQRYPTLAFEPVFRFIARQAWRFSESSAAGKAKITAAQTKASAPGPGAETGKAQQNKKYRAHRTAIREGGGKVDAVAGVMGDLIARKVQLTKER